VIPRRVDPSKRLTPVAPLFPRRVGVTALAKDGGTNAIWKNASGWPNHAAADEVTGCGIRAIQLWPYVSLTDEDGWPPMATTGELDMTRVFENPGLDLVVIRPMQHSFSEKDCEGKDAATWEGGDWGEYAEAIYQKFGHISKVVILTNWEGDWQLWGPKCRELHECPVGSIWPGAYKRLYAECGDDLDCKVRVCNRVRRGRALYLRQLFEERQIGIEEARNANLGAKLRIYHAITVNHTEDTPQINVSRDVIPKLDEKPDLVGLSHWDKDQTIIEALDYIRSHVGCPRNRIFLTEIGAPVGDTQGVEIYDRTSDAFRWGVAAAFVWVWKQHWDGKDMSLIASDGVPNPGLGAVLGLRDKYDVHWKEKP
jgi:hypothetical protein